MAQILIWVGLLLLIVGLMLDQGERTIREIKGTSSKLEGGAGSVGIALGEDGKPAGEEHYP